MISRAPSLLGAEPTGESEGITRRVVLNLLEAFFRRPWLYLLPLVVLGAVGAASGLGTSKEYQSVGTISATTNETLAELTEAARAPGYSFESPATITARQINEFMRTRVYLVEVSEAAGLDATGLPQDEVLQAISESLSAVADGDNLVRVGATADVPDAAKALADAAIATFIELTIQSEVSGSLTAVEILGAQVEAAESAVTTETEALRKYFVDNNIGSLETQTAVQQLDIAGLQAKVDRANTRLAELRDQLAQAQLRTGEATTVVEQRLRVVDPPEVPVAAASRIKDLVMTVALFVVLGVIVAAVMLVLSAALDRTVRVPNDITAKYGLEVLAVVPRVGR